MVAAFSSLARILGESLIIHSPQALFFFFFKVEISSHTLNPLFRPESVHSGSASWDDCGWMLSDKLHVSSFLDRFKHYAWTVAVSPLWLCWVKGVSVLRCHLLSALLAEWPGSFTCHCSNTGVERTPNKSQHTKLPLEKKTVCPLLTEFKLATFDHKSVALTNKLSRLHVTVNSPFPYTQVPMFLITC